MNVKLLRKVAKHISEEPKRLIMGESLALGEVVTDKNWVPGMGNYQTVELRPPCGTAACIAGWTCLLTGRKPSEFSTDRGLFNFWGAAGISASASTALDIRYPESERLFILGKWPLQFRKAFLNSKTPRGRVGAAVRRIEHFIKTKGAE